MQSEQKWKQLAELATAKSQFGLAQECLHHAQDFGGLLLLATASGNSDMVGKLAKGAEEKGLTNVAFLTFFLQGKSVSEGKQTIQHFMSTISPMLHQTFSLYHCVVCLSLRLEKCLDLLVKTKRLPEAAFLARTYLPSHVPRCVCFLSCVGGAANHPMPEGSV